MPSTGRTNMPDDAVSLEVVGKRNKIPFRDSYHFCHLGGGDIWIFLNHPNNFQCSTRKCNWCRFGYVFGDVFGDVLFYYLIVYQSIIWHRFGYVFGYVFGDVSSRNRNQNASRIGFKYGHWKSGCSKLLLHCPLIPSVKYHGGKSTALKGDMQGGGGFFCRLAIGRKRRRNAALTHGARDKEREGCRKWREDCEKTRRGLREGGEGIARWRGEDCERTVRVALTFG